MREKTKQLTIAAILLALCVASQTMKSLSVYITGPIVNACLILAGIMLEPMWCIILAVVTPVTAFFIAPSPVLQAIPVIIPCIMAGNAVLSLSVCLANRRRITKSRIVASIVVGSFVKAMLMGVLISLLIVPAFLPEKLLPKMTTIQMTFSAVQLITALIGGVYAFIIWMALSRLSAD